MYPKLTGAGWKVHLSVHTAQIQGGRSRQEDTLITRYYRQGLVCVLADGMGGRQQGDEASSIAAGTAALNLRLDHLRPNKSLEQHLQSAFIAADAAVVQFGKAGGGPTGSTLVAGVFHPRSAQFHAAYIGDSLCYLSRGRELTSLFSPQRQGARLLSAIGLHIDRTAEPLESTVQFLSPPLDLRPGDRFLFASDGLELIDLEDVKEYLRLLPRDAVERMIVAAIAKRVPGADNLSIAVVEVLPAETWQ